jgi:hypothetical protein
MDQKVVAAEARELQGLAQGLTANGAKLSQPPPQVLPTALSPSELPMSHNLDLAMRQASTGLSQWMGDVGGTFNYLGQVTADVGQALPRNELDTASQLNSLLTKVTKTLRTAAPRPAAAVPRPSDNWTLPNRVS